MSVRVKCPSCGRGLSIPDHLSGRPTVCPWCSDSVPVPPADLSPEEEAVLGTAPAPAPIPDLPGTDLRDLPKPSRLGALSAGLGLASVLILCLPFVGYAAIGLSGVGLVLGLYALALARRDGTPATPATAPGGAAGHGLGARAVDWPLAGVAACLVGLGLALWPLLTR